MKFINTNNIADILSGLGHKTCVGIKGRKCLRPRRNRGRLCVDCHREYMREYMRKKSNSGRVRVVDDYNMDQTGGIC
jgi:hypothetical protein